MKRALFLLALSLTACARPASAAEVQVLAPQDKSVVRGRVEFHIRPLDTPNDQFLDNPWVIIRDQAGQQMDEVRAPRNRQTGICSAAVDTTRYRDGQYQVEIKYRTLVGGQAVTTKREMTLAVRNSSLRAGRFTVELEAKNYRPEEDAADVTVKVLDSRGKPMPGARVAFKVDKGDLESPAEITDSDGEAFITVQSDEPQDIRLTITVEGLAPVVKTIRFVL